MHLQQWSTGFERPSAIAKDEMFVKIGAGVIVGNLAYRLPEVSFRQHAEDLRCVLATYVSSGNRSNHAALA